MQSSANISETELLERLDDLPDRHSGARVAEFTPEQDAALMKYWKVKRQSDVARIIGFCTNVCARRYNELVEGE